MGGGRKRKPTLPPSDNQLPEGRRIALPDPALFCLFDPLHSALVELYRPTDSAQNHKPAQNDKSSGDKVFYWDHLFPFSAIIKPV
jgi:hypothetical protein